MSDLDLSKAEMVDEAKGERANLERQGYDHRKIANMHDWLAGRGLAPFAESHLRTMANWHKMNVWDREDFRRAQELFPEEKHFRWTASIPLGVLSLMLEANPNLLADEKEWCRWLRDTGPTGGAKYRVPR